MHQQRQASVLAVFAHPDDESLGAGGLLARLSSAGVTTHLLTATRGEAGWKGSPRPRPERIAEVRERELRAAAATLGVRSVRLLGLPDGGVADADAEDTIRAVATHVRDLRPAAVVTFGSDGITGHPDHIAVSEFVTAALVEAAGSPTLPLRPHRVSALWHIGMTEAERNAYEALIGPIQWSRVDPPRRPSPWEPWQVTAWIDTRRVAATARDAVLCHRSQLRDADRILNASLSDWRAIFRAAPLYRAMSLGRGPDPIEELASSGEDWGRTPVA